MDVCRRQAPPSVTVADGHVSACWLHVDAKSKATTANGVPVTAGAPPKQEEKR
jgi:hypothetical protein